MFSNETLELAETLIASLKEQNKSIVTIESCTGGLVAAALTEVSGSSEVVYGGFITYANKAKTNMIGVPVASLEQYGAVSEQVARAMAEGGLSASGTDIAISITGVAGPTGGTQEKPVGLVHFACATKNNTYHLEMLFGENLERGKIRQLSVNTILEMSLEVIGES